MGRFALVSFPDDAALAAAVADRWPDEVEAAAGRGAVHLVALPGGRIIRRFFDAVVAQAALRRPSFAHVHFFWGDERCVPPNDPASNHGLAQRHLLAPLDIPAANVHRIRGEAAPAIAAAQAEEELRQFAPASETGTPVLDLVLLGLGEDGHVASLFPGLPCELAEGRAAYLPVAGPKPPPGRVTLGYTVLAAARQVWVLASGTGKTPALAASLSPGGQTPLARVLRERCETLIFTDLKLA
ncbi:MAG: 6-phosphogluconolactonase [Verrucomicrobia bacterium]|nr:6-phosphogluconolactonase [Verrucomicrobiota bacterium]